MCILGKLLVNPAIMSWLPNASHTLLCRPGACRRVTAGTDRKRRFCGMSGALATTMLYNAPDAHADAWLR